MLLVGVAVAGCQTRAVVMRAQECARLCPGCCDAMGACLTGEDVDACGAPGAACQACGEGSTCADRACRVTEAPTAVTDAGAPADGGAGARTDAGLASGVDAGVPPAAEDAGTSPTPCPPDGWCLDGLTAQGAPVTTQHLRAVWARTPSDVWVVGDNGTVLRFNGAGWATQTPGFFDDLHAVWARAADDVWVAGGSGDPAAANGLIARFDGSRWTVVARGLKRIEAIWGRGASEVWFGGWDGALLRWNGSALLPEATPSTKHIADLTGNGSRVWAVGSSGLVLEHDGTAWREVATGMTSGLVCALALGPSLTWVAGGNGAFATWDGAAWRTLSGLQQVTVMGLWGASPTEVWSVGPDGELHRFVGVAPTRVASPTTRFLRDVHGADARNVWAVGFSGTVLRYRP
jgi:hypothetical protein